MVCLGGRANTASPGIMALSDACVLWILHPCLLVGMTIDVICGSLVLRFCWFRASLGDMSVGVCGVAL